MRPGALTARLPRSSRLPGEAEERHCLKSVAWHGGDAADFLAAGSQSEMRILFHIAEMNLRPDV